MKTPEQIAEERNDEKIKAAKKYAKQYEGLMYTIGSIAGVSGIQMAFERGVAFGLHQALEITVEREKAERAAEQHWISIKDRLPEENQEVLISYGQKPFFLIAFLYHPNHPKKDVKMFCGKNNTNYSLDYVTHWQPLPEPPKEER